jgi:hypothetical protein
MRLLKGICKLSNHRRYAHGNFIKLLKHSTSHIQTCELVEQITTHFGILERLPNVLL